MILLSKIIKYLLIGLLKIVFVGIIIISFYTIASPISAQALSTKRIEVNLNTQHLYAYAFEGDLLTYSFLVSTGKPWWPTPTGTFKPWIMLRSDRMIGGSRQYGTYYDLPNVPYVVYFYQGYALHGTYWHNNFGHPMSHGCINLRTSDMEKLYYWMDMNTPITIYGTTPNY